MSAVYGLVSLFLFIAQVGWLSGQLGVPAWSLFLSAFVGCSRSSGGAIRASRA